MRTQLRLALVAALLVLAGASCGGSGGSGGSAGGDGEAASSVRVQVSWLDTDASVAGYVLHWGTTSRVYTHEVDVAKPVADAKGTVMVEVGISVDPSTTTYYFAISSYDASGGASGYSNELSVDVTSLE